MTSELRTYRDPVLGTGAAFELDADAQVLWSVTFRGRGQLAMTLAQTWHRRLTELGDIDRENVGVQIHLTPGPGGELIFVLFAECTTADAARLVKIPAYTPPAGEPADVLDRDVSMCVSEQAAERRDAQRCGLCGELEDPRDVDAFGVCLDCRTAPEVRR